ncbi:DNA mismatch repair protein MLH3-like isoform X2 [Tribolium madens]|uniref:DNA mismatch repair protein MLH3-like isoform X2 n=1 Tax=Tribolium madens TaxID=41895 RepID=UPI001CF72007|nr:DNA mismatch repair protein MLH3-like isoform X2 [Tribolium madens]
MSLIIFQKTLDFQRHLNGKNCKMVVEPLEENVIARIRSSSSINSVTQCITELVLNSLDAKATAIAVRVNLTTFRIQVVDNGRGISRSNLEFVGKRYMTNKCHSLDDLRKHLKFETREPSSEKTFVKIIEKNEGTINLTKCRASHGTTVTVEGFLNNLPVRQQCVKNNELENVKRSLESLIIIHPRVSFTLRNDLGLKLILSSVETPDIASSFKTIHPEIDENEFALLKVSKNKTRVEGLIYKQLHENKRLQYLYVNKRPINSPKIQNFINSLFKRFPKHDLKKKNPIFVIHIKCPYSDVDITLEPAKTLVFFKKMDTVKRCLQKMINTFIGGDSLEVVAKKSRTAAVSEFGVSQIGGAVKGFGTKRKSDELEEMVSNKSAKIVEDTPYFGEPRIMSKQTKVALPIEVKKGEKKEEKVEGFEGVMDNSLYTNFPENEKKGKDVIMDMFIMSLEVFPPENKGNETFCQTEKSEQFNETFPENSTSETNKVAMEVQTTIDKSPIKENMVSIGIQAGPSNMNPIFDNNITFLPRKSMTKFVSDYDFDFSKLDALPTFDFKTNNSEFPNFSNDNQPKKLFDFRNPRLNNIFDCGTPSCAFKFSARENTFVVGENHHLKPKKCLPFKLSAENVKQSPYFSKKSKARNLLSLRKSPQIDSNKGNQKPICTYRNDFLDKTLNQVDLTFIKKDNSKRILSGSHTSKYFTPQRFKSCKLRVQTPKYLNTSFEKSKDLFSVTDFPECDKSESKLFITLDEEDNTKIIENESQFEGKRSVEDIIAPTLSQPQNMWIKPVSNPKNDITFEIAERFDFVPKGLSPILKDFDKVDDMSPQSKQHLQDALIKSYEDELLMIKWQNYIDDRDPKKFFEEIYLEKSKMIEGEIPNAFSKHVKDFENISFTKDLFKNIEIIGQVDCKFIAVWEKTRNLIVLFDQHAVHERVRLEELSEGYKNASTKLDQDITLFLQKNDLTLLRRQKMSLRSLGLVLDFFTNGLTIYKVPLCLYNKSKKGVDIVLLTQTLIKEIVDLLKDNNEIIVNTPSLIQNIVNSEACRGAIKFGDSLTKNECFVHLKNLGYCKLPFQCAHGRPTLTPLIYLNRFCDIEESKPRLRNLKQREDLTF